MKSILLNKTFGVLALGIMGLAATGAQAAWGHDSQRHQQVYQQSKAYGQQVNARQDRQAQRIRAGKRSGQLTRFEFRELMQQQRNIRAMEQHFRADGRINAREFKRLDRALDVADRRIRTEKHDRPARRAYGQTSRFN